MKKRWRFAQPDPGQIGVLERRAGVAPVVAQLLLSRGLTDPDEIRDFLEARLNSLHDPEQLAGVTVAADRLIDAVRRRQRIVIYGDYDADGMTATAILVRCLKLLGADVGYYVPNRLDEGYGLNSAALVKLAERGTAVVVSVDCGIASVVESRTAREIGLDLIITDHHAFGEELPDAVAIVHPRIAGQAYPFGDLCGAGVAFKLAWALCQRASDARKVAPPMREFLLAAIGLVAVGTVADVVPLLNENRVLVRHGLDSLYRTHMSGLAALLDVTQLNQKPRLTSEDIGFVIAPRLNAAGRLGQGQLGVELLVTESRERARALAEYLHELNRSRESLERSIYLAANKQVKEQFDPEGDSALVLAGNGWHPGVIGIVAGRLAEKYHRPVVMIALDQLGTRPGSGSARSPNGLDLHRALDVCREHLVSHGGHAAAAGLKIEEAKLDAFRADFCEYAATEMTSQDRVAEIRIDAEAPLGQLTLATIQQVEQLAPFGAGNPRPILAASAVDLAEPPKRMGGGERHLSARLCQMGVTLRAVAFGQGDWADEMQQVDGPMDIAYKPVINEFRGRRNVELHLVDWRVTQPIG